MDKLFRGAEARHKIREWFEVFRAKIEVSVESREFSTNFGPTHLLVAGPKDAPPLVLLHGAMASSAHVLATVPDLLTRYRVYAVDIVGQSVMSAPDRPSVRGKDYGRWLVDVPDKLEKRSRKIFANLVGTEILAGSKHCPPTTVAFGWELSRKMDEFFKQAAG